MFLKSYRNLYRFPFPYYLRLNLKNLSFFLLIILTNQFLNQEFIHIINQSFHLVFYMLLKNPALYLLLLQLINIFTLVILEVLEFFYLKLRPPLDSLKLVQYILETFYQIIHIHHNFLILKIPFLFHNKQNQHINTNA